MSEQRLPLFREKYTLPKEGQALVDIENHDCGSEIPTSKPRGIKEEKVRR